MAGIALVCLSPAAWTDELLGEVANHWQLQNCVVFMLQKKKGVSEERNANLQSQLTMEVAFLHCMVPQCIQGKF
ncbi:hypothetical protein [Massilia pseudoviolaceinigra]|uniref:hypothetical protein n=1 Tax=Massilia pseudoviolaceinigra TaxID=3057165 RepID=UPI0027969C24|nr:hypothetical protein [Massilia sp. CCM 9206]MDQ1924879.1 hypothetical protein [Massilia sp. CCM 9206]